ncbi:MAG: phosphatidate cytidylyltransferase [Deltaproteobacteria bacterium]|nr:phosphatidate cytidylyltransferase [Deltaproteobacteria bacterium]
MTRVVTTLLLAAGALAGVWYLPLLWYQCLILVAIGLGLWEYGKLIFTRRSDRFFVLLAGAGMGVVLIWFQWLMWVGFMTLLLLSFLWGLKFKDPLERATTHVGLIFLGICYLSFTLPAWSWIRALGREWVMLLLFSACLTDTFSFLVGKSVGRHKLAPVVSPYKTWEGFFGGLFGGVFGLWLASRLFFKSWEVEWIPLIGAGIAISLLAIAGDLIESLIKRSAHVKDSSHLIPGHGGVLDRLDALVFVAPFYYFVVFPVVAPWS